MKYRMLIGFPLLLSGAFLVVDILLFGDQTNIVYRRFQIEIVKLFWVVGAFLAAGKYQKGDYLRRAWGYLFVFMMMLILRDMLYVLGQVGMPIFEDAEMNIVSGIMVVSANFLGVMGMFMLARTWKVADLNIPVSKKAQILTTVCATALALAIVGPAIVKGMQGLLQGNLNTLVGLASSLGDIAILILIAPLLLTALALRGGFLFWPWVFMTISTFGWLFYDATNFIFSSYYTSQLTRSGVLITEFFRATACLYGFSAAISQCIIVDTIREKLT